MVKWEGVCREYLLPTSKSDVFAELGYLQRMSRNPDMPEVDLHVVVGDSVDSEQCQASFIPGRRVAMALLQVRAALLAET